MRYMYLGEVMETVPQDVLEGIERLSRHLEILDLWELVLVAGDPRVRRKKRSESVKRAQENLENWFQTVVLGRKIELKSTEKAEDVRVDRHNEMFADVLLQADEFESEEIEGDETDSLANDQPGGLKRTVIYPVHKALLRSEFFTIMFNSQFREGQQLSDDEPLQIIPLDMTPDVLELVLAFFYSDKVEIPLGLALDTLFAADQLFIDRLKTRCAQVLSTAGSSDDLPYSIYDVIRAGWLTRIPRLEEFGAKYIAERLEFFIDDKNFGDLVQEVGLTCEIGRLLGNQTDHFSVKSAERIEKRQETDTIELIDDIRYYLDERFRMRVDDMGIYEVVEGEGRVESPDQSDREKSEEKEKEKEPDNAHAGQNKDKLKGGNKQSSAQEERNLNTEATFLYDSLLGQIDELLGTP